MKRCWWSLLKPHLDTTEEACAHLARIEGIDAEVRELGTELERAKKANNFSSMVAEAFAAIRKPREEL